METAQRVAPFQVVQRWKVTRRAPFWATRALTWSEVSDGYHHKPAPGGEFT